MNNVAVAALMLPVVMDIARKTNRSPSTLLMPLAYRVPAGRADNHDRHAAQHSGQRSTARKRPGGVQAL